MRKKIIIIIGTTGVGKTKLSFDISSPFEKYEIINTDALQLYSGLAISTNKPSPLELSLIPHHLINILHPLTNNYSIPQFLIQCNNIINDIHSRNKIPILVGGTMYYTKSIIWLEQLIAPNLPNTPITQSHPLFSSLTNALHQTPNNINLHSLLSQIDPQMSQRWHPNDTRKIKRSLEIFYNSGIPHSTHLLNQSSRIRTSNLNSQARYDTLVLWPFNDLENLYPILDSRVDDMIANGLFDELSDMQKLLMSSENIKSLDDLDYSTGILQSIGFKEFKNYFNALYSTIPSENTKDYNENLQKLKLQGIQDMKKHTRQYAKRQVSFIKNKLMKQLMDDPRTGLLVLDAQDLSNWESAVKKRAIDAVEKFINDDVFIKDLGKLDNPDFHANTLNETEWRKYKCSFCIDRVTGDQKIMNGEHEWNVHINGRNHKRNVERNSKSI